MFLFSSNYSNSPESLAQSQNMGPLPEQLDSSLNFDNMTSIDDVVEKLMDWNLMTFFLSLFCAIVWVIYITFYNSRVAGLIVTKIINHLYRDGFVKIGSLSFSVISGKIMFRDVSYVTEDCSYRVQDGCVIFRWWRTYVPKDISEDMSHSDTRLSILVNGFEYHLYHRSELYSRLEKLFGLDALIIPGGSKEDVICNEGKSPPKPPSAVGYSWRDLIPVIKLEMCSGRVVFGNMLVPYTLALVVEEAHLIYTTKPAASKLDHFMHIVKCKAENFKVLLSQSPKYTGLKDDPPRLMGEGFGIVTSNKVEFYYYMDEAGIVPEEPEMLRLANGDLVEANPPIWGIDIKCGKGTDFSYGPWADRQRDQLYKLFYPQDYQSLKPTSPPRAGELRQIQSFDVRLSTLNDATIDILFSRDQETNAIHMNVGPGSYLEITIPWIVHSNGYTTNITGQLLHLEASTSLQYRNLIDSETLQFSVDCNYPLYWNDHQDWVLDLTGCKASAYLTYAHKWFFQAMINDWSSRTPPDLLSFVPYTWRIKFILKEFEIITPTNDYNWIDCTSQHHENTLLAACGELFELSFDLPFHEFLPETVLFKFWIQIEGGDLNFYIPEVSSAYIAVDSLYKNSKVRNRDGSITWNLSAANNDEVKHDGKGRGKTRKWRKICLPSENWIECWSVPICAVSIDFIYHPMPPLGPSPQADVTTPEKEESLLSPMRIPGDKESPKKTSPASTLSSEFDPSTLSPDHVHVECEVGPSVLHVYGALLKILINLKENVFGEFQDFIDMEKLKTGSGIIGLKLPPSASAIEKIGTMDKIDPREYRPLEVSVSATLHDIRGHLLKNCGEMDPPCPTVCVERFGFEMDKKYRGTILQVLLSPIVLLVNDNLDRSDNSDQHLKEGYLMLSGLQVRGHAMFSNEGRSLDQETLEYAWLVEVQLGKLSGRLTTPHIENIVSGCEAFLLTVLDSENSIRSPQPFLICHHGNNQLDCPSQLLMDEDDEVFGTPDEIRSEAYASSIKSPTCPERNQIVPNASPLAVCPTSEDIKYKFVRVSFDAIDLYLVESGTALSLWVSPIRFAFCNLHGSFMKEGFSLLIPTIQLRHFIMVNHSFTKRFQFSDLNIPQSSETMTASSASKGDLDEPPTPQSPTSTSAGSWTYLWLETGAIALGPLTVEIAMKGNSQALIMQNLFLIRHDRKTKRLWFIWNSETTKEILKDGKVIKRCGCVGGCTFFGSNIGGSRFFWPSKKDWTDGINVACFRVKQIGEDFGFGQSILNPGVLMFDTPPYTTQQGDTILELPTEWSRDAPPKSNKTTASHYVFKPSLLADLSHTSSSAPSNRSSERISTSGSSRGRRLSQPTQGLKRQRRVSDDPQCHEPELLIPSLMDDDGALVQRASSCCSDSKLGIGIDFQSFEEDELTEILVPGTYAPPSAKLPRTGQIEEGDKKNWRGSLSSLDSLSDLSFISALSVQEECMVNLQMHLNKPITESSLLMPCYMSHLTQLKCDNWHAKAPTVVSDSVGPAPFVQMQDGKLVYAGSTYTPYFEPLVDGFTTLAMVGDARDATKATPSQGSGGDTPLLSQFWDIPAAASADQEGYKGGLDDELYRTLLMTDPATATTNASCNSTTILVRTRNDVNIMVSPMLLEALKRFVEAITPTLSSLHPSTVINHLHNDCMSRVKRANILKKEKAAILTKVHSSKRNTALRTEEASPEHSSIYEEISQTAIQGSILLPKINVTLLQASVVEEVISFSALDNIRDLMCVSLLAVAIEKTNIHFLLQKHVKKSVQVLQRPVILPKTQKKRKSKVSTSDSLLSEPVFLENSETQSELISSSVDIHRIHGQLRRLKNDSSIIKEAVITAIPNQHSKVLFKFAKLPVGLQEMKDSSCSTSSRDNLSTSSGVDEVKMDPQIHVQSSCPDEKLGFIMFECGLEGISLKGIKNSETTPKPQEKEETASVTICNEVPNHRASSLNLGSEPCESDKDATLVCAVQSKEDIAMDRSTPQPPVAEQQSSDVTKKPKNASGAASISCVIKFEVMWYNFAAPPQTPFTRKIDYTRVDWNLVSTASTAINAWLNPVDQLTIGTVALLKGYSKRSSGLLASLMAEALDCQSIHQPIRSKYNKLTPLAKTLQEDPSCQLCIVLQRYVRRTDMNQIEANVSEQKLPPLSTLRQGVIVLSRQWKNVLYTPLLLEHNLKSRKSKHFTVTFTLPQSEEESPGSDGEMSVEETTDERATLLDAEGGTSSLMSMRFNKQSKGSSASLPSVVSGPNLKTLPAQPVLNSTRASDVYPLAVNFNVNSIFAANAVTPRDRRSSSIGSILTGNWSMSSSGDEKQNLAESGRSTPGTKRRNKSNIVRQINEWNAANDVPYSTARVGGIMSEQSHEESLLLGTHSKFPQHPSLMLLDAHVIFQPLLTSLGLMPHQIMGYSFEHLGSHMSIKAAIDVLRVDIVESEVKGVGRGSFKGGNVPAFVLNLSPETPAFLCENIGLEGDFQKSTDLTREVINKKSVIYLSRNYWKKQAKSTVIFSLNIDYISQQVNMPLLRLLHQITTMYQNVRETQMELREQRPSEHNVEVKVHKNSSSSGSDIQEQVNGTTKADTEKLPVPEEKEYSMSPTLAPTGTLNTSSSSTKGSVIAARTQSFAQRFRSSAMAVRSSSKANMDGALVRTVSVSQTPTSLKDGDLPETLTVKLEPQPLTPVPEVTMTAVQPNCWRTIYYLLDLYATRPETKTIINRSQLLHDTTDPYHLKPPGVRSGHIKVSTEGQDLLEDAERGQSQERLQPVLAYAMSSLEKQKDIESPRFSIFIVARIQRTRLLASLSGLKLEAEIMNLQATSSYSRKIRPMVMDMSLTGHVGHASIVLLEGIAPNQQTVVRVSIEKSGALYSGFSRRAKDRNSGLLQIGPVHIDIPQHPVVLHGMMTRSTKQLSNTLQEFRANRAASRISRGTTFDETEFAAHLPHAPQHHPIPEAVPTKARKTSDTTFFQPLHMQFSITVDSLSITASLLPSLQAQYKMERVKSCGLTGSKAKFQINLPAHSLSFTTKVTVSEANLPSAASIPLPLIDVCAEYIQDGGKGPSEGQMFDGAVLRHGSYLSALADIGAFEHCLTTDLLNHLLFVQKVFMKEVNEVVIKMSGGDKPVPLWEDETSSSLGSLLFTLKVRLQGIQITATTPTNTAVRLETGQFEFQMSNRVQGMSKPRSTTANPMTSSTGSHRQAALAINNKVFIKAQVDVNLSLGQLIRNIVFEEADSEYQQYAFFKTRIALRNALSDEISGADADKEVVLITLARPLIYVQPIAVDKAILVWLNYKSAYEYWNEQRSSLNTEVLAAMPSHWHHARPHIPSLHEQSGTLFLQLTVDDMGISIPLSPSPHGWSGRAETDSRGAVVLTLESTSISACSSGSLVSNGKFKGLCFRFTDDMVSMDDWKPNFHDPAVMNFCVVSEGTYEVCSKTTAQHQQNDNANAKWFLNVKWQMEGVDMHVDVNVGKQLSALGHTLTSLAAFEEDEDEESFERDSMFHMEDSNEYPECDGTPGRSMSQECVAVLRRQKSTVGENVPAFLMDPSLGPRQKRTLLEKEMQERVNLIEELQKSGASTTRIEEERKRLQDLENFAFRDFRRDWIKKLRRQSTRASSKFGLGSTKPLQMRSKSLAMPSPDVDKKVEFGSPVESTSPPSTENSPQEGPSRSHSMRFRAKQRTVTFGETQRQFSVDSANLSTPDEEECAGVWLDNTNGSLEGKDISGHMTPGSSVSHKAQEPNVDLELDVKVFINSGKCVLHTKPKDEDGDSHSSVRKRSERSGSGYDSVLHISSPLATRKARSHTISQSKIKSPFGATAVQTEVTIFHIPGLDVKIHYDSHILYEGRDRESMPAPLFRPTHERSDSSSSTGTLGGFPVGGGKKTGTKKASLFAWITLHSVPEETIISPHILDFLEQTLEPIPMPVSQKTVDANSSSTTDTASVVASTYYASFPVDVVVYFHMQPSTFRFSCQPISRVECMLRLPSLDVVFSSKRADDDEVPSVSSLPTGKSRSWKSSSDFGREKESQQLAVGGLSVTGCLSDFSVYIFHPYGAAKRQGEWSPLSDNERKDSVSMNVEFVKLHLSRSRKIHVSVPNQPAETRSFHQISSDSQHAAIRFSSIVDIGSASFKYDMRRLTEILAFPKAWYRRSIVRRLFFGDLSTASVYGEDSTSDSCMNQSLSISNSPIVQRRGEDRRNSITFGVLPSHKDKLRLNLADGESRRRVGKLDFGGYRKSSGEESEDDNKEQSSGISRWETLVLFTVNFTKLNVHMNMGNVMGNVNWLISGAKSDGRISIGSTGHKNVYVAIGLNSSFIDAKGGIVAGTFELTQLSTFGRVKEDPGIEPHHNIGLQMFGLELRLDFMGTSALMGRVSALEVNIKDEWHVRSAQRLPKDVALATYRPAMIFIHGDMSWDQLQLLISKSTTVDILKMHCKLEEFFSQQFKSSKYVFSTLQVQENTSLTPTFQRKAKRKLPEGGIWEELRHHRHWQDVLSRVSHLAISSMPIPLPESGTVLGGSMDLHGNNISLACFHGVNFKAKSWALFSMKEPFISFSTEAQETHSSDSEAVHVIQNLNFSLGQQSQHAPSIGSVQHESMAMICKVTRNVMFPPQFRTLHEWFHYAFAPSEIDDVQRFPSLEKERERLERERADSGSERRTTTRLHDPNHNREVIFALPSLELFFKTEHLQSCKTPDSQGARPIVECSFITEFGDHIFVTVDAEAFFFLHDLITSYVKEKEKLVSAQLAAGRSQSPSIRTEQGDQKPQSSTPQQQPKVPLKGSGDTSTPSDTALVSALDLDESAFQRDWRDYVCKTWQLEPTVRLLSWAGKSIEPYGVDYILHKLGFSHARITIPKWMQRGFCDPLDKVLSVLVYRMIDLARRETPSTQNSSSRH